MSTPANATELFNVQMPASIAKAPDKAREVDAIYVFIIKGEGGGEWTVDLKSETPGITQGIKPGAGCTIEVENSDFMDMMANPNKGMQLFMMGKLKVTGNPALAMKLQKLFSLG